MDDVEDSSELRRGIPVAHKVYGVPQTINSANYVYFLAMQQLHAFNLRPDGTEKSSGLDQEITGQLLPNSIPWACELMIAILLHV